MVLPCWAIHSPLLQVYQWSLSLWIDPKAFCHILPWKFLSQIFSLGTGALYLSRNCWWAPNTWLDAVLWLWFRIGVAQWRPGARTIVEETKKSFHVKSWNTQWERMDKVNPENCANIENWNYCTWAKEFEAGWALFSHKACYFSSSAKCCLESEAVRGIVFEIILRLQYCTETDLSFLGLYDSDASFERLFTSNTSSASSLSAKKEVKTGCSLVCLPSDVLH